MADPNPSERLAEIEARVEVATAGPWLVVSEGVDDTPFVGMRWYTPEGGGMGWWASDSTLLNKADAKFIANAREDIPWRQVSLEGRGRPARDRA